MFALGTSVGAYPLFRSVNCKIWRIRINQQASCKLLSINTVRASSDQPMTTSCRFWSFRTSTLHLPIISHQTTVVKRHEPVLLTLNTERFNYIVNNDFISENMAAHTESFSVLFSLFSLVILGYSYIHEVHCSRDNGVYVEIFNEPF